MGEVVSFGRRADPAQDDGPPSMVGSAICYGCGHEWAAVLPIGSPTALAFDPVTGAERGGMECPKCGSLKGIFQKFVRYTDCPNWGCLGCGGHLLSIILAKGDVPTISCATCGRLSNGLDIFNT